MEIKKAVIAIDSFKGSVTSKEAGNAAKEGILKVFPNANIVVKSIADGGEDTTEAIVDGANGEYKQVVVINPIGEEITAKYGIINNDTAVVEVAKTSGITLVEKEQLNPMIATTYGLGQMIKAAIENGCKKFVVGLGGSATNDGGVGMLQALGFSFLDEFNNEISKGAIDLGKIKTIKCDNAMPQLKDCEFIVACDVKNPLCGDTGCSAIYGPQKGATKEQVKIMDKDLLHYAQKTKELIPTADLNTEGAGAAGGLGFALMTYLNAKLTSGINLVLEKIQLEEDIKDCDIVITGEGKIDLQTVMGKAPTGVANLAKKHNKKVFAFSGIIGKDAYKCNENGIDAFFPVLRQVCSIEDAMNSQNAIKNISDTVEQVFRVVKACD